MKRSLLLAAVLLLGLRDTDAQAVDPRCTDPATVGPGLGGGDGCQKAVDLFNYMHGQLGMLISGGNATLGQGGTLGGFPHFALSVRGNSMYAWIPAVEEAGVSFGPARQTNYRTVQQTEALPAADAALGVFKGITVGSVEVGGVDALLSAAYLPEIRQPSVTVTTTSGAFRFGFGGRIGLVSETTFTPAVSLTYIRRSLPTSDILGTAGRNTVSVHLDATTTAWRLVVGKTLGKLGLAVGIGEDRYASMGQVAYIVEGPGGIFLTPKTPIPFSLEATRTNLFGDVSLGSAAVGVVVEGGIVYGGDAKTSNPYSPDVSHSHLYVAAGLRFGH